MRVHQVDGKEPGFVLQPGRFGAQPANGRGRREFIRFVATHRHSNDVADTNVVVEAILLHHLVQLVQVDVRRVVDLDLLQRTST